MILFLTFAVILVTLVGQGLILPSVIRALGIAHLGRLERRAERAEEYQARLEAITAATDRLREFALERDLPNDLVEPHLAEQMEQLQEFELVSAGSHRRLPEIA